jgi:hypothetical protein
MAIDFPNSPATNDTYTVGSRTWTWTGTIWELKAAPIPANSVGTAEISAGAVTAVKLAADARPKTYITKYTTYTDNSWTCPAGVTQIKLTLVGAGGASGDASASTQGNSASQSGPGDTAGSTTFTAGGTTYTALGGKKGLNHSVTGDIIAYEPGQSSSGGTGSEVSDNRYPGCGGAPLTASAVLSFGYGNVSSRAFARSLRGQDGVREVFQVTVVPATTYSFSIGVAAGWAGYFTTDSYMGSNGAVIIEYVV